MLSFGFVSISIHVLREEDDKPATSAGNNAGNFNPRPPRGGRRDVYHLRLEFQPISIHVLREEDDSPELRSTDNSWHFNPRPPRGGRLHIIRKRHTDTKISIHVLREEDDRVPFVKKLLDGISIHVLREEDDRTLHFLSTRGQEFQSTSSARRTTTGWRKFTFCAINFNPRPPRGGRQLEAAQLGLLVYFNPRPPRGGRRCC